MSPPDGMSDGEFMAAMRDAPQLPHVRIETDEGIEIMFYGSGPGLSDGGTLFIPHGAIPTRPDEEQT
jgi:hypothetical protein